MQRFNGFGVIAMGLLALPFALHAQCEVLDNDGNGVINGSDMLPLLGATGTPDADYDFNASGWVDIEDVMQGARELGQTCPVAFDLATTGIVAGAVLELVATHTDPVTSSVGTIPAGSTTYRLYVQTTVPGATCQGIFGRDAHPMTIESDNGLFSSSLVNTPLASQVNPLFFSLDPTLPYASWLAVGYSPDMIAGPEGNGLQESAMGDIEFDEDPSLLWDGVAGTGAFLIWPAQDEHYATLDSTLHLVGQFTTLGAPAFATTFNVVMRVGETYETATGLEVNEANAVFAGCMDPTAYNFDPLATIPIDVCLILGDFDGDGVVSTPDLLALLAIFGCETCPEGDLDGDGVVSVGDILMFLGLFGQ